MKSNPCRSLLVAVMVSILLEATAVSAQSNELQTKSDTFGIRIAIENDKVPAGQAPRVQLTIWNLTNLFVGVPGDSCAGPMSRAWVQGEYGEPPTTARERFDTGRMLPGDQELACTLNVTGPPLSPASMPFDSATRTFELEYLYDLRAPGSYTVQVDVPVKDGWLRSNTVAFQILAADPTPVKGNS